MMSVLSVVVVAGIDGKSEEAASSSSVSSCCRFQMNRRGEEDDEDKEEILKVAHLRASFTVNNSIRQIL